MSLYCRLCLVIAALVVGMIGLVVSTVRAEAACPLEIAAIQPIAHGPDGKATLYLLKLRASSAQPVSATVSLAASDVKTKPTMRISRFIPRPAWDGFGMNVTFEWKDSNLDAVTIDQVSDELSNLTPCLVDWKSVNSENGGIDAKNLVTSLLTPDPGAIPAAGISSYVDADFTTKTAPEYPASGEPFEGTMAVMVSIGTDGHPMKAWIAQSSGKTRFDAAALHAAKTSLFTPAKYNGQPIASTYKIVYLFSAAP